MGRWSWSSDAFDFDHDGYLDIYIANGMISGPIRPDLNSFFWRQVVAKSPDGARTSHDYEQGWNAINELIRADGTWSGYERNVFYANNHDGTFSDVSGVSGLDFLEDGRSFALADFDRDGRQEILLKNRNAPQLRLLKNVIDSLPPSIIFRLRGTKSNRDAIGAVVTIETKAGRQTRSVQAGSGFLSQHSKELFFGLGEHIGSVQASIRWPSGDVQHLSDLPPNHRVSVAEGNGEPRIEPFRAGGLRALDTNNAAEESAEELPTAVDTWLIDPIMAPDFSLPDVTGQLRSLAAYRGKPLLLGLFVWSSADCQKQLSSFRRNHARWAGHGLQVLAVNFESAGVKSTKVDDGNAFPWLQGSEDTAAVYNILVRYAFDRHRDLVLPASFLIDEHGRVAKIYQGPVSADQIEKDFRVLPKSEEQRLERALPFKGVSETFEFGRNYLSYGSIFYQRGYFEQSAKSFEEALRDDPTSAEAAYGLGSAYLSQQKIAEARESFERAAKLHASYPDTLANAWNNLGLLAGQGNRTDEAIKDFREAVRLSPDHLIALNNLGNAYRQQKNWEEAKNVFEHALEVDAGNADSNYGLAMIFAQRDDTAHAYEYLQRALQARPDYPEALNNIGILYLRTRRRDEAVASFETCLRVAPRFDQAYLNLARVYLIENNPEKARSVLMELLKQLPDDAQGQSMLARLPQ